MKSKTITVKLSPALDSKLEQLAANLKKTKSLVVRLAIQELLRQPKISNRLSSYTLLAEYAGSLTSLPADLSSSSKHLEGYGN